MILDNDTNITELQEKVSKQNLDITTNKNSISIQSQDIAKNKHTINAQSQEIADNKKFIDIATDDISMKVNLLDSKTDTISQKMTDTSNALGAFKTIVAANDISIGTMWVDIKNLKLAPIGKNYQSISRVTHEKISNSY